MLDTLAICPSNVSSFFLSSQMFNYQNEMTLGSNIRQTQMKNSQNRQKCVKIVT